MTHLVAMMVMLSLMAHVPQPPDWRAGLPEESWEWIHWVAGDTGESRAVLAAAMYEESKGEAEAIGYCGQWRINPPDEDGVETLTCVKQLTCESDCKRRVWKDRLDIGPWQLRQPGQRRHIAGWVDQQTGIVWPDEGPGRVWREGTFAIRGHRWVSWYAKTFGTDDGPECTLGWECSSKVMAAIVEHLNIEYAPKDCKRWGSKWPNELSPWLAWFAGTGKYVGCSAREERLDSAYLGKASRLATLDESHPRYDLNLAVPYFVMNRVNEDGSLDGWYVSIATGQMVPGSLWQEPPYQEPEED